MDRIKQMNVAFHGIYPFSMRLKSRYGFENYTNLDDPCFFWGCLGEIEKINNHRGLKIVKFLTPADCKVIDYLTESDNLYIISDPHFITNKKFNFVDIEFEYQYFDIFKPKPLGEKIYCYMRDPVEFGKNILMRIQKKIKYEIIFGGEVGNAQYYDSLEELKRKYYDHCFLSINLSKKHGYTTVRELGFMGIKTLMSSPYNFPSIIQLQKYSRQGNNIFVDDDEIIDIINKESTKIGSVVPQIDPHNVKDEWLDINFWKNKTYEKYSS